MQELELQKYLRSGNTFDDLKIRLAIESKQHKIYKNLWLLKYNQIDSPPANPIVLECRGIILDQDNNWEIVGWSFRRFFNYGEGFVDQINWNDPSSYWLQEKVDGSKILLTPYQGEWLVSTSGTPGADSEINKKGLSFADLFWKTIGGEQNVPVATPNPGPGYCFTFELTAPENRVVVVHDVPSLTLIGARRTDTWEEVHPREVFHLFPQNVKLIREFPSTSYENIQNYMETMSPLQQEGFVVVGKKLHNGNFPRLKIKSPQYVALHRALDGANNKYWVEVIRSGEMSEVIVTVLEKYPEYTTMYVGACNRYDNLVSDLLFQYETNKHIMLQKDFAAAIKNSRCSAALFQLRSGKVYSIKEYLAKINIDTLMKIMGY